MREVEAYDLELYALNTGEFYRIHQKLAEPSWPLAAWSHHVKFTVLERYSKEIDKVCATNETIEEVARNLQEYYQRPDR